MKYIVFYDNPINSAENRYVVSSCRNKIEYVFTVLENLGEQIDVISPSLTKHLKGFYKSKEYNISPRTRVYLPATFGAKTFLGKAFKRIWQCIIIYLYTIQKIQRNDIVFVYHSLALTRMIRLLKIIKGVKIILHVEEIYSDVTGNKKDQMKEFKAFKIADGFIFSTEQLNTRINMHNKPYAISHGNYSIQKRITDNYNDGRIHCVYAGTFDSIKGGCEAAIKCTQYLDNRFFLHIIGFGTNKEKDNIINLINLYSPKTKCLIKYDGEKKGDDFIKYIQKCHIGLSTQNPSGSYNNSSFPSKILTYLANGLKVVSIKIPVVEQSSIGNLISYYEENKPECLAKAIMKSSTNIERIDYCHVFNNINKKFHADLKNVLEKTSTKHTNDIN